MRTSDAYRSCLFVLALSPCALAWAQDAPPTPTAGISRAQTLLADGAFSDALQVVEALSASAGEVEQLESLRLLRGRCLSALGRTDEALTVYNALTEEAPDAVKLAALQAVADIHLATGDLEQAEMSLAAGRAIYVKGEDARLRALGAAQYFRTRVQYDGAVKNASAKLRQLAEAHEKAGNIEDAVRLYRQVYEAYPEYPGARADAVRIGNLLGAVGDRDQAQPFYCHALGTGTDRVFHPVALLADNQWYLDEAARPPDRNIVHQAIEGINHSYQATSLPPEPLQSWEDRWYAGLEETFEPSGKRWRWMWLRLAKDFPQQPWQALCLLASAEGLLRVGAYVDAVEDLDRIRALPTSMAYLKAHALYLRGLALAGQMRREEAEAALRDVLTAGDDTVAAKALYTLAELAEGSLRWTEARQYYRLAGLKTISQWQKLRSDYALKRVGELAVVGAAGPSHASLLPDDRETRGNWMRAYGEGRYVLCAQNFILDRVGGSLPEIAYDFSTISPQEPSRLWVSQKQDDDPAALWDPGNCCRRSANRDDYGEQFPLAEGPDLLLKIEMPLDVQVVSLYFVNDHNYYEPQRAYTISVSDGDGLLHAVTSVENFGGGVYKRFLVSGPSEITFHIWRNMSLNTLLSGIFIDRSSPGQP